MQVRSWGGGRPWRDLTRSARLCPLGIPCQHALFTLSSSRMPFPAQGCHPGVSMSMSDGNARQESLDTKKQLDQQAKAERQARPAEAPDNDGTDLKYYDVCQAYSQMNRKDKAERQAPPQHEASSSPEASPIPGSSSSSSWQSVRAPSSSDFTVTEHPTAARAAAHPSQAATPSASFSCPSSLASSLESLALSETSDAAPPGTVPLTRKGLEQHTRLMRGVPQRRQFNCPTHGVFFKKVLPKTDGRCVARCRRCNGEALKASVAAGEACEPGRRRREATLGPRLEAVPLEEERGRGLFVCRSCNGTWTSNRACRSLAQWCSHVGCEAAAARGEAEGELPVEIRPVEPVWSRNRRLGFPRDRRPRNQEEDEQGGRQPALASVDERSPLTGDGAGAGGGVAMGGGGGVVGGGDARSDGGGRRPRASLGRAHWCCGCAAGLCALPPPQSPRHFSTGSTQATPSVTTFSSNGSAFSVGSVQTRAR